MHVRSMLTCILDEVCCHALQRKYVVIHVRRNMWSFMLVGVCSNTSQTECVVMHVRRSILSYTPEEIYSNAWQREYVVMHVKGSWWPCMPKGVGGHVCHVIGHAFHEITPNVLPAGIKVNIELACTKQGHVVFLSFCIKIAMAFTVICETHPSHIKVSLLCFESEFLLDLF